MQAYENIWVGWRDERKGWTVRPSESAPPHLGADRSRNGYAGAASPLGLTQAELAAKAKVSRRWIPQVENGKATAEIGVVFSVFSALDSHTEIAYSSARRPSLDEFVANFVTEHSDRDST